ncbi:SDR family oxidoreductase [Muricauda sp. NFXS6]|uniref:SDR family oxidoreductase n=1 Tax=Allomuricauda sp. NFXS6 TaxID=2819094 RepID=UPI0032DF6254
MKSLQDKTIFITGANRGIGKSLVKASLEKGARKIYAAARNMDKLPDFGDNRVVPMALDISNTEQVVHCAALAVDTNVLINNAGILEPGNILEGEMEMFRHMMETNYFSTLEMMRAFAPVLTRNAPGILVNIVSIVAYSPLASIAGYSAAKAALYSATLSVRCELADRDIVVHAVNPGAIDTDMNKGSEWEMPSPDRIAPRILEAVEQGTLDIVPDDMGQGMYAQWKENPEKLAKTFHDMYHIG